MKKNIYSLLAMSVSVLMLTSCSTTKTPSTSNQKGGSKNIAKSNDHVTRKWSKLLKKK